MVLLLVRFLPEHYLKMHLFLKDKYYNNFPQLKNFHSPDVYIGTFRCNFMADESYKNNVRMLFKIHNFKTAAV